MQKPCCQAQVNSHRVPSVPRGATEFELFVSFFCFVLFCFLCVVPEVAILDTHSVDEACLELGDLPASASHVLGLKACGTIACQI